MAKKLEIGKTYIDEDKVLITFSDTKEIDGKTIFVDLFGYKYYDDGRSIKGDSSIVSELKNPNTGHSGLQKEHHNKIFQLYTNHYGRSLKKVEALANVAKANFPTLTSEDITIVIFGGISKKHIMGIRFSLNEDCPPDYYDFSSRDSLDETVD